MTNCKQLAEKYEELRKGAAEFALTVEKIRGGAYDREKMKIARAEMKRLVREKAELEEMADWFIDKWAVGEICKLRGKIRNPDESILPALAGLKSKRAQSLRADFPEARELSLLASYTGIDSPEAWALRKRFLESTDVRNAIAVLHSLAGLDCEEAWEYRDKILGGSESSINVFGGALVYGLQGVASDRSFDARERLATVAPLDDLARSLAGLDCPRAWKIRETLMPQTGILLSSIYGLNCERAWKIRENCFANLGKMSDMVKWIACETLAEGLIGLDDKRAWKMRRMLIEAGASKKFILRGLAGCRSAMAQKLRDDALIARQPIVDIMESYNGSSFTAIVWRTARKQAAAKL